MAPVQTTYLISSPVAFPGMDWHSQLNSQTSAIQAEASAEIPFGVFVALSTSTDYMSKPKAVLIANSTDKILGAVIHQHTYNPDTDLGTTGLKPKTVMDIRINGFLWLLCEQSVTPADPVYVRYASGSGGTQTGAVRKTADTSTALLLKGARFETASYAYGAKYVVPVYFDRQLIAATAP
jgi:hypothetical protein